MSRGYVYVATGRNFVKEAIISYQSLKRLKNTFPVILYTDKQNINFAKSVFDQVLLIEKPQYNFIDKIEPLITTPFDRSIFIDTDTYFASDISGLFNLLDAYEFMACFAPGREQMDYGGKIPSYFPEFNTGLIGFKKCELTLSVLTNWKSIYSRQLKQKKPPHDQPAFREALFNSKATIFCLPSEYNFRIEHPNIKWGNSTVKVIHGRHDDFQSLEALLNKRKKSLQVYFHEARFLSSNSLLFFRLKQNGSLFFRCFLRFYGLLSKIKHRFGRNTKPKKIKGN